MVGRIGTLTALVAALLAVAAPLRAADIGANDDTGKFAADGGTVFFGQMKEMGLRQTVLTVRFRPSEPFTIQDKAFLDSSVPKAVAAGLRVVFAVYPYPPREIESGLATPVMFAGYVASLAREYPAVRSFVIGNEPNQPAFWRPQFATSGRNASATAFGLFLAAAYDALKDMDPELTVVGAGLSPRGNDRPDAVSNISTSPVRFLRALGAWYRASGRTRPLMDGFGFHPYPNQATDPLDRGYAWPNAGFVNLDRVRQALWDAFHDTPQPTPLDGLRLHLDEVGWQVDTTGYPGYTGLESVKVTDELTQAAIYGDLVRRSACDPGISEVNFFGFYDDSVRDAGFQAALHRVDGTPRPAAEAVRRAIADSAARGCTTLRPPWQPATTVVGARVVSAGRVGAKITLRLAAGEDANVATCALAPGRAPSARTSVAALRAGGAACSTGAIRGGHPRSFVLRLPDGAGPTVTLLTELAALANPERRTVVRR
jgi:hypothetical protein